MPHTMHYDLILPHLNASSPDQAFVHMAGEIAQRLFLQKSFVFDLLRRNEQDAPSGIGEGIAIPHLKLPGIHDRFVCLATLTRPADFKSFDDVPVDIICVLLSPQKYGALHIQSLARITRMLKNPDTQKMLRETKDADLIRTALANPEGWFMAA